MKRVVERLKILDALLRLQPKGMNRHEPLKMVYERESGKPISDRQWQRIRFEYLGGEVNLVTVRTVARLRQINGRRKLTLSDVKKVKGFDQFATCLDGEVTGQDILDAFGFLKPTPSESTIKRWGKQLGLPLCKTQWYTAEQAQTWIRFVGDRVRFKFPDNAIKKKGVSRCSD